MAKQTTPPKIPQLPPRTQKVEETELKPSEQVELAKQEAEAVQQPVPVAQVEQPEAPQETELQMRERIRQEVIAETEEEMRERLRQEVLSEMAAEAAGENDPEEGYEEVAIDLGESADHITINGAVFFHGFKYKVPKSLVPDLKMIMFNTRAHEEVIKGTRAVVGAQRRNIRL